MRLGIAYVPYQQEPEELIDFARLVDRHLDDLWVWEDCFRQSGLASAAVALSVTERVRVGLGLMPVPLRNVALAAMEIATLQRTFPGRFVPAVGHGVLEWMAQAGVRAASPLTLLDEYTHALTRLLAGEQVSVDGRYVKLDKVQLVHPPAAGESGVLVGGFGPKTQAVAGRRGAGLLLATASDRQFAAARAAAERGWAETHDGGRPDYALSVMIAVGAGAQERLAATLERWDQPDEPGASATGTAEQIAEVLHTHAANGASVAIAQPVADEPDLAGLVAFLGEEVLPLIRDA